jgi:hypothetical protein
MRARWGGLVALAVGVLWAGGVRAGVYLPVERVSLPLPFSRVPKAVHEILVIQRQLEDNDPQNNPESRTKGEPSVGRLAYLEIVKRLEKQQADGVLQPVDKVNLGGCYIRLGRYEKARLILEQAIPALQGDKTVLLLAKLNLSAAIADADPAGDLLPKAIQYQEEALSEWPQPMPIWAPEESQWYRRAEQLVLQRLKDRKEQKDRAASGRAELTTNLRLGNVLFPGLRFEGPGQEYQVGSIQPVMWTRMPPDAIVLVVQLRIWSPRDPELLWLYGELLNANGQRGAAAEVLKTLVDQGGVNSPELFSHRRLLVESVEKLVPIGMATDLALAVVAESQNETPSVDSSAPASAPPAPSNWLPDWKTLGVGFLTGFFTATLVGLQVREWRRRQSGVREEPPTSPPSEGGTAPPTVPTGSSEGVASADAGS